MFYFENIKYLFSPLPPVNVTKFVLERAKANEIIKTLKKTVESLLERERVLLERFTAAEHPKKLFWDGKHEERIINYNARNIPYTDERISVDVRTFLTPGDITVRRWAKRHSDLVCDNPLKYDGVIHNFYLRDRLDFVYAFDDVTSRVSEVWLFPFELDFVGRGDCEDHAHRMKSRLNALGLPDWRSRVVCGITRGGDGHSTVYYLSDDLETWVHLNSTTPGGSVGVSLPTINDSNDLLGIGDVWFSFNKEKSWSDFGSQEGSKTERFKYLEVLL